MTAACPLRRCSAPPAAPAGVRARTGAGAGAGQAAVGGSGQAGTTAGRAKAAQ